MPTIRQLPPHVVNKIAAGEVIERPASLVKELVENAVDAGSTRVDVAIEAGGMELVRVADNGCGIEPDQLELAVASHATSKIETADDLFRVGTLGFRGEALASIAAVSQFRIRSRTPIGEAGAELDLNAGEGRGMAPCGCPVGTTIEVRNLFFNTPVRRKFLRSTPTEFGHVGEAFTRIALAFPQVHFTLRHNDRLIHDLAPASDVRERVARLFGPELGQGLIWVESNDGLVKISGYVANPAQDRNHNRMQYLFLNGRHIRDRALQHALGEAYRGLLMVGRYPVCFLRLEMPPEMADVNVHPTKLEVRFQDSGRIYSSLLGAIRKRFLTTDLTAKVQPLAAAMEGASPALVDPEAALAAKRELVEWAKGQLATAADSPDNEAPVRQPALDLRFDASPQTGLLLHRLSFPSPAADTATSPGAATTAVHAAHASPAPGALGRMALQVHNRYLVAETDDGLEVIDQHALHERILYEQLREKVQDGNLESQRLLVPEPVDLSTSEATAVLEAQDALGRLGIEVQDFGGGTVLVAAYPSLLANMAPGEMLRQVLEVLLSGGKQPDRRDLFDRLLHGVACKAAIKAGDRLSSAEITALLQQRHLAQDAHHCPHGRPTTLIFTRDELDRRFGRI